jgi:hypothetical protein
MAIQRLSGELSTAVTSLVNVANQRITPAETIWNRRDRIKARQRLGQSHNLSLLASGEQS